MDYSVLIFERESFLAGVMKRILTHELREYRLSIHSVNDFKALGKELARQGYDLLMAGTLGWNPEDYTRFIEVIDAYPGLHMVLVANGDATPANLSQRPNTVVTPGVSTRISSAVLVTLLAGDVESSSNAS